MASDQQCLPNIEVTIAANYVISFLYNKLPRRRVDVFAEELSSALHRKLASENSQGGRAVRIAISPPLEIDGVVTDAIRSCGLTVEEVVQELPLGLTLFIEAGEVSYCMGNQGVEPIPIYSTRRGSDGTVSNTSSSVPFFNPSVDATGLLDGVDPNLLALLTIRPMGNNNSAQVPTAVFAQTKFGSTKFRSQASGNARRPSRLNGGSGGNGGQNGQSPNDSPHGRNNGASNGQVSSGNGSGLRSNSGNAPSTQPWAQQPQQPVVSPTSRYHHQANGANENVYSSPPLPPVVTSATAAVLGNQGVMPSTGPGVPQNNRAGTNNYRTPSGAADFAFLLQDFAGCGSAISSPALSDYGPSLTNSFDSGNARATNGNTGQRQLSASGNAGSQRHSYHAGSAHTNNNNNIPSFFPNTSNGGNSSNFGSLLFDSGVVSPSSWSSSTPVTAPTSTRDKLQNSTFSDHSNSSSTSSSGSLLNASLNGSHGDSWGLAGSSASNNGISSNVFSDSNATITGTSQWVQSLRLAAVGGTNGWDQLTATEG